MREANRKEGEEEPVVLNSGRLEQLPRELRSKVEELVQAEEPCRAEVGPRIIVLKAKLLPEGMLQVTALQLLHDFVLLVHRDRAAVVVELDADLMS